MNVCVQLVHKWNSWLKELYISAVLKWLQLCNLNVTSKGFHDLQLVHIHTLNLAGFIFGLQDLA